MGGGLGRGLGGGLGDDIEDTNDFEDVQIIDMYSYINYISRPENDIVDNNYKAILILYVSNAEILE